MSTSSRPTLEDVARVSGYSRATISRVVRNVDNVDPRIVSEVNAAIKKTGYRINLAARALAGGSTQTIGVVFRENFGDLFQNSYWGQVLEGIYASLSKADYQQVFLINDSEHFKQVENYLINGHVDGVLFLSVSEEDDLLTDVITRGIPVSVFGPAIKNIPIPYVNGDELAGGAIAAEFLLKQGAKKLGVISGGKGINASKYRVQGFTTQLSELNFDFDKSMIQAGDFTREGASKAIEELLKKHPDIDGIFVLSDLMAVGVLEKLRELGKRVPEDILLVSMDNSPTALSTNPQLSSIGYNAFDGGKLLGELILEAIAGKPPRSVTFMPTLFERESSKRKK
jgi:DNA-binding LacI/PurR family transcriptional regulator